MGYRTYTCTIARSCGGCEWLAVPYPIQLRRKQEHIEQLFHGILHEDDAVLEQIIGMSSPVHYRHKAASPFAPAPHGRIRSGFYRQGSHYLVACRECLAEDKRCRKVLNAVAKTAELMHVSAYDEDHGRGFLRYGVVRAGWKTDELLLTVVANGERLPHEQAFVSRLIDHAPEITAMALNSNQRRTNAILGSRTRALVGGGILHDQLLDCTFEIGPTSFYQTNPEQTERLYQVVLEDANLHAGATVLDAYCGTGTIGICAAYHEPNIKVIGVERGKDAVHMAKTNARANGVEDRCTFVAADATAWMEQSSPAGFDTILLDPPRAGSTPEFLLGIARCTPERVVYVSCNPETLHRDLLQLRSLGYRLRHLTPVDLFPHTKHLECVATLSKVHGNH